MDNISLWSIDSVVVWGLRSCDVNRQKDVSIEIIQVVQWTNLEATIHVDCTQSSGSEKGIPRSHEEIVFHMNNYSWELISMTKTIGILKDWYFF